MSGGQVRQMGDSDTKYGRGGLRIEGGGDKHGGQSDCVVKMDLDINNSTNVTKDTCSGCAGTR